MKNNSTTLTRNVAPVSSAVVRCNAIKERVSTIKDEIIERYTAAAVELATLRAVDPTSPRINEIELDYPWIDEDFGPELFEPEFDEFDADFELSNRFEGVTF